MHTSFHKFVHYRFLVCTSFALITCSENESPSWNKPYNLYVLGLQSDASGATRHMVVWENGKTKYSVERPEFVPGRMTINDKDVYVAARDHDGIEYRPAYWKNDEIQYLEKIPGEDFVNVFDIAVKETDTYVVGNMNDLPYCWKNGLAVPLPMGEYDDVRVMSVTVSGDDVYAGGYIYLTPLQRILVYWKNGEGPVLVSAQEGSGAMFIDLEVSGTDVYVLGIDLSNNPQPRLMVWKNGIAEEVTDGEHEVNAYSLFVKGEDVYVTGYEREPGLDQPEYATVWKNGIAIHITDGTEDARASAAIQRGDELIVVGSQGLDAFYAINDKLVLLPRPHIAAGAHDLVIYEK